MPKPMDSSSIPEVVPSVTAPVFLASAAASAHDLRSELGSDWTVKQIVLVDDAVASGCWLLPSIHPQSMYDDV